MLYKMRVKEAPTLKDLVEQIAGAVYGLGKDAQWTGHKDGRIYAWRKDHYTELAIEPKTKYLHDLDDVEVVR